MQPITIKVQRTLCERLQPGAGSESTDEWPFLDLAIFLLDHDRAEEALGPLRTAIRIQPGREVCHEKLGRALLTANDVQGSIGELEEATRLDPNDPKAHFELGRALRQDQSSAPSRSSQPARSSTRRTARNKFGSKCYCLCVALRNNSASRAR